MNDLPATGTGQAAAFGVSEELQRLLDAAVARLSPVRRTFTEEDALASIWEAGYEVSPQTDPRFALARDADGRQPRHWRLTTHTLANDRLLDALHTGAWNGHDLDAQLIQLDSDDEVHYVFCSLDNRFHIHSDGTLEPADHEPDVALPPNVKETLDALGPALLERWHGEGNIPWTVRRVSEVLDDLGWTGAGAAESWLLVRSWLIGWPDVVRAGQHYWVPANAVPAVPERVGTRVRPVHAVTRQDHELIGMQDTTVPTAVDSDSRTAPPHRAEERVVLGGQVGAQRASWTATLRTANLLHGFLHVPKSARAAYPPRASGEELPEALRGRWFDSNEPMWLWLNRGKDWLYGPDLTEQLAWLQAGARLRIDWEPDVIVLRSAGHDEEVQREETRLVDVEALTELRGALGESYRASVQTILSSAADGMSFRELVETMRERLGHEVHRGTIRSLLHAGGFVARNGRWFAAPDADESRRRLRSALRTVEGEPGLDRAGPDTGTETDAVRRSTTRIKDIHSRLSEIVASLRANGK